MATILSRKPGGSGGGGGGAPSGPAGGDLAGAYPNPTIDPTAAVTSIKKTGSAALAGDVTLTGGTNVTLTQTGQDISIAAAGGGGGLFDAYALLSDEKASGTNGGTFTQGAWQTRVLNTEVDPDGIVSLSADQFSLAAGTYFIKACAPALGVDIHKAKLRNVTDSSDALIGTSEYSNWNAGNGAGSCMSFIAGRITIAGTKAFEIQHRCTVTTGSVGFGVAASLSVVEIYTQVEVWREA